MLSFKYRRIGRCRNNYSPDMLPSYTIALFSTSFTGPVTLLNDQNVEFKLEIGTDLLEVAPEDIELSQIGMTIV